MLVTSCFVYCSARGVRSTCIVHSEPHRDPCKLESTSKAEWSCYIVQNLRVSKRHQIFIFVCICDSDFISRALNPSTMPCSTPQPCRVQPLNHAVFAANEDGFFQLRSSSVLCSILTHDPPLPTKLQAQHKPFMNIEALPLAY